VIAIVGIGGVGFGRVITVGIFDLSTQKKNKQTARRTVLCISTFFLSYALIATLSLLGGILFPVSAPIISWVIAILTSSFILLYCDQALVVERQLSAERKAVIDQASSQLQSIADRVHQDALHHMKLAMDWLELMQIQNAACDVSIPLEKILRANKSIRENLIETRLCAEKLPVSSELRLGLHMAIHLYTRRLRKKGELALRVDANINSIRENSSSRWIEASEGVFSFYRESINNIIRHAQPPRGKATKVTVDLERIADVAVLRVTNDGEFSSTYLDKTTENFGTQVMEKVASRLPNGQFRRRVLTEGDFQVELSWSMNGFV
jgi:signal transduction histidine kinase